jgi:hypothetical protein
MLGNGVSAVAANGIPAKRNTDNGQQWALPTAALSISGGTLHQQLIAIEVFDVDGGSYGTFQVQLDAAQVHADCSSGKWASVAISKAGASARRAAVG